MELVEQADLDVEILAVKELAEHCKGFVVERPRDFLYHPGQYMLIELVEDYGTPFSLASSPTEEVLKFATVIRKGSPLKEEMDAKEPGDNFIVSGPYGELIYEEKEKNRPHRQRNRRNPVYRHSAVPHRQRPGYTGHPVVFRQNAPEHCVQRRAGRALRQK